MSVQPANVRRYGTVTPESKRIARGEGPSQRRAWLTAWGDNTFGPFHSLADPLALDLDPWVLSRPVATACGDVATSPGKITVTRFHVPTRAELDDPRCCAECVAVVRGQG